MDAPRIHPLTLRFDSPDWERDFREEYVRGGLTLIRVSGVVGILVGILLGLGSQGAATPGALAVAVGPPILLNGLMVWATFAGWFHRYAEWVLGAGLVGWGLISAGWVTSHPDELTATGALFGVAIVALYAFVIVRTGFVAGLIASAASGVLIWAAVAAAGSLPAERALLVAPAAAVWLLAAMAGYFGERYARREFVKGRLLDAERARSEALLLNVLPAPIAARLKAGEEPIADGHPAVTVLFADLVGSTELGGRLSPEQLVETLNDVFTEFDRLAAAHGLEKIKTVGDAYMAVAGLPTPRPDHASAAAELALDMLAALGDLRSPSGEALQVRIGVNSGPVVAGVIGTAKFAYDLWGDAVNTASRMESHGVPGAIQVTETTYRLLEDRYAFEPRGAVEVKGKGSMQTYLLKHRA